MKKTAAAKFLLTPLREGRPRMLLTPLTRPLFLLTPLREGRPCGLRRLFVLRLDFYSRPCGRGDVPGTGEVLPALYFSSRPCGRGDPAGTPDAPQLGRLFLLTPLREGRLGSRRKRARCGLHFYSRPCGRGDYDQGDTRPCGYDFYSRPCGRGDCNFPQVRHEVLRQIAER